MSRGQRTSQHKPITALQQDPLQSTIKQHGIAGVLPLLLTTHSHTSHFKYPSGHEACTAGLYVVLTIVQSTWHTWSPMHSHMDPHALQRTWPQMHKAVDSYGLHQLFHANHTRYIKPCSHTGCIQSTLSSHSLIHTHTL